MVVVMTTVYNASFNTLRPRRNGRHFADDILKCIFVYENVWIPIKFSLKFVPKGLINNIPAMVQIMAWRRPGDEPLSEPRMVTLPTHICVIRSQWVNLPSMVAPVVRLNTTESRHHSNFVVTGSTGGCRHDSRRCRQLRQSWHWLWRLLILSTGSVITRQYQHDFGKWINSRVA